MTDVSPEVVSELVDLGLERREARWLAEEFLPRGAVALRAAAHRRLSGEPLQYIIGHWPFRTLDLDVDRRVLIPRPETEGLVDVALDRLRAPSQVTPLLLDLGCGSGAIGFSLLNELRHRGVLATLVSLDESSDALEVAQSNARKHGFEDVTFVASSWFDALDPSLRGRIDLIVSNPPYVGEEEFDRLDPVLGFEPRRALVSPDAHGVEGLEDLAVIVTGAMNWLRPGGALVVEHGETQHDALLDLAERAGYHAVRDVNDLSGRPRVLTAQRPA